MAKIHFERIRMLADCAITGTLCNHLSSAGDDINSTGKRNEVTCKFCLRRLSALNAEAA